MLFFYSLFFPCRGCDDDFAVQGWEGGRERERATLLAQLSLDCHPLCGLSTFGHTVYLLCGRSCRCAGGVPLILRKFPTILSLHHVSPAHMDIQIQTRGRLRRGRTAASWLALNRAAPAKHFKNNVEVSVSWQVVFFLITITKVGFQKCQLCKLCAVEIG